MGVMLSVLLSYVGAIELVFIVRDVTHQLALHQMRSRNEQRKDSDIDKLQTKIKTSIDTLEATETVKIMQDGVLYENGYRIDTEHLDEISQQWNERRKSMCIAESSSGANLKDLVQRSIVSDGSTEVTATQNERTKNINFNENDRQLDKSDSPTRMSREEELKLFTSLGEEECNNANCSPIRSTNDFKVKVSNNSRNEPSLLEQRHNDYRKDDDSWGNVKSSNLQNSGLWKPERATSSVEERNEENHSTNKNVILDNENSRRSMGTADKSTRKTSCENDPNASELIACLQSDRKDNCEASPEITIRCEDISMKLVDEHIDTNPSQIFKKVEKQENLNQYFSDTSDSEQNTQNITSEMLSNDEKNHSTMKISDDVGQIYNNGAKSRDTRSTTVYSRSDSESSNIFHKSMSRDSSSTFNEPNISLDYLNRTYDRTDSCNSFIQDEIDSEEYHHNQRFSMTADTLEYIRGRDDWKLHTDQKLSDLYRRQSSGISVREEIDSDEYHHVRSMSDAIQLAYLDADSPQTLPSSYEDKVFEKYYLELEQIKDHLSNDIQHDIAKKQVVFLESNQIQTADGYSYPLPDIAIDQIQDEDEHYTIDIQESDYGNVTSESEDDIQSVIEVSLDRSGNNEREIIATLDMNDSASEMIEVTLWDLKDDLNKDLSSRESSAEIINVPMEDTPNEELPDNDDFEFVELDPEEKSVTLDRNRKEPSDVRSIETNIDTRNENSDFENVQILKSLQPISQLIEIEAGIASIKDDSSASNINKSFIEHEKASPFSVPSSSSTTVSVSATSQKNTFYENVDDLIKEACMGVWFHN